jgi:uncharacterized membrane protein
MARFTVWKFDNPEGADKAALILKGAASEGFVKVYDHAVVEWPADQKSPKTKGANNDAAQSAGLGALFGLVIGSLFFLPFLGAAAGAAVGGISRALSDVGIKSEDLDKIKEQITPGTSALFVITEQGDTDRLGERFHGVKAELISSNLTDDEEKILLETFGGN